MNVWRKQTIRWRLKERSVKRETPKAKRIVIESKRWYGTLRLASGKRKQVPLCEDEANSETLLRRLQCAEDSKRANGADRYCDFREQPIDELLDAYEAFLSSKNNTKLHVTMTVARCKAVIVATKTKTICGLDAGRILQTLHAWRERKTKPLGIATSNHYLIAIKGFSRWLWRERKTSDDPLAGLRRLNAETDRRRLRRALSSDELKRLATATQASRKTYLGSDWQMTPTDRVMLYATAAYTGLRACELASLGKASFDLQTKTLTLDASFAKNRKTSSLPLHPALAERLGTWFKALKRETLWPGTWVAKRKAGKFLKRDLKRAGIAYVDATGRYADFHALRYTFITSLARAGVHPARAQRLARHSTINLTMNVYTSLDVDDLREAINVLP